MKKLTALLIIVFAFACQPGFASLSTGSKSETIEIQKKSSEEEIKKTVSYLQEKGIVLEFEELIIRNNKIRRMNCKLLMNGELVAQLSTTRFKRLRIDLVTDEGVTKVKYTSI